MKRCFHKALWGVYHTSKKDSRLIQRRARTDGWISKILNNKYQFDFRTYVFGSDNFKYLEDLGVKNMVLVDSNPAPFDLLTEQYRNKLEAIKACFEEGYTEVCHQDWDVIPQREIDENFWTIMNNGAEFQANLQQYRRIKTRWRSSYSQDLRKIPNGGMFYLRDKKHLDGVIRCWEQLRAKTNSYPSCEPPMAMYVEELMGGKWLGKDEYFKQGFEPLTCDLHRCSCYGSDKEIKAQKTLYFLHYQG